MTRQIVVAALTWLWCALGPVAATAETPAAITEAMHMNEIFAVMSEEGAEYGKTLQEDMFPDRGGESWRQDVKRIYAVDRMSDIFEDRFAEGLEDADAAMKTIHDFLTTDLGQRIVTLEISARRALLDDAVEEASRLTLDEMRAEQAPRLELVEAFVEANDLVEANVVGGLNANYAFYQGLRDAGALGPEMDDTEVIREVWSQEDDLRQETDEWIHAFLLMAYAPLSDEELKTYTEFSETEAGQVMNRALFAGFDAVFVDVSHELGRAAGSILSGQEL